MSNKIGEKVGDKVFNGSLLFA